MFRELPVPGSLDSEIEHMLLPSSALLACAFCANEIRKCCCICGPFIGIDLGWSQGAYLEPAIESALAVYKILIV